MPEARVDLASWFFWLVFAIGVAALAPLTRPSLRRWTWAAVNVLFLFKLLHRSQFALAVAALLVVWVLLHLVSRRRTTTWAALLLAVATASLFIVRKTDYLQWPAALKSINPLLAAVGFSYVALRIFDVLRAVYEERHPAPGFADLINYLVPFHMLAAGPIEAYDDFVAQPAVAPRLSFIQALEGSERIALGLTKKFVLARIVQDLFLVDPSGGWYQIVQAQMTLLWLYFDFSGYTDVAVGMGRLMGVSTPENFNYPFLSRNMIEFWSRWHISLSQFIRRNLFVPTQVWLMRNTRFRHPLICAAGAFMVSFGLCGFWHEASLRYVVWGLLHAAGLTITNCYRFILLKKLGAAGLENYLQNKWIRVVATIITFEFVALSLLVVL